MSRPKVFHNEVTQFATMSFDTPRYAMTSVICFLDAGKVSEDAWLLHGPGVESNPGCVAEVFGGCYDTDLRRREFRGSRTWRAPPVRPYI